MKKKGKKFKVGDKIVEFGQVFRIFKIEQKENLDGDKERILHFRPYYKSNENNGMVCSIPESSVDQTTIRRPHSKEKIKEVLNKLTKKPKEDLETDVDTIKELLALNDPHETVRAIRGLWLDKIDEEVNFTKSKKDMFELATSRLVEEVAFVINVKPEKVEGRIRTTLEKSHK